ncbi:MAG: glycine betaine ABC transporter substrate-binding protein [Pseudomonadota bacterium]
MFKRTLFAILAVTLLAAGCSDDNQSVKIGSKNFGESNVLSHMMAILAKEQGLKVEGPVEYASTQAILAALKQGDVDVYPDYNGTGLVMLGQNPISDGDKATERVKSLYEPLGLTWLPRFGFANNYGLAMRTDRAKELGLTTMSDLVAQAGSLRLGIEDDFQGRPLDGLTPMLSRYGMAFGSVEVVKLDDRAKLYDMLLDGKVDVAEVYTTDGQIPDFDLKILQDDLQFFPVYQAAPLARADALSRHANLGGAIGALAGKIDAALMQKLNARVEVEGRSAESVARNALLELGLIKGGTVTTDEPLQVASTSSIAASELATTALRATRRAFPGREVKVSTEGNPLDKLASGDARLALVGADAFFDLSGTVPSRNNQFEAVAVAGQNVVHLVGKSNLKSGGNPDLANIKTLATGPEGSDTSRLASILIDGLGMQATLKPIEAGTPEAVIEALTSGQADAALVVAPLGNKAITQMIDGVLFAVLPLDAWKEGANLVRFPFLREVRVPANTYRVQRSPIETLGVQVVLAGMAPVTGDAVGDQGPSSVQTSIPPIPASTVKTLGDAIPGSVSVDPTLQQSGALAPALPQPPAAINPAADISVLNLAIVLLFIWLFWLYGRPEHT